MSLQIRYSQRASQEYKYILMYVIQNFGVNKAKIIDGLFEKIIFQIAENPKMCPFFDKKRKIRRCVISKQTTLYYRITGKYIDLVSFRSNMMNTQTLGL